MDLVKYFESKLQSVAVDGHSTS